MSHTFSLFTQQEENMATTNKLTEKKRQDASVHLRLAEKCLKTSFLKWKPDHDGAADEFDKAAIYFKNGKAFEESKRASLRAAESHDQCNSTFHAAKAYEQAAYMSKEMNDYDEFLKYILKAKHLFQLNGNPDTASTTLDRAAKSLELNHPLRAAELCELACEIGEDEDRCRQAVESLGKAARLYVRIKDFSKALLALERQYTLYRDMDNQNLMFKVAVHIVLIHLALNDTVAAEKSYSLSTGLTGFDGTDEAMALNRILEAYEENDPDMLQKAISMPLFKYLDNDYVKLCRALSIPENVGEVRKKKKQSPDHRTQTTDPSVSPPNTSVPYNSSSLHTDDNNQHEEDETESYGLM